MLLSQPGFTETNHINLMDDGVQVIYLEVLKILWFAMDIIEYNTTLGIVSLKQVLKLNRVIIIAGWVVGQDNLLVIISKSVEDTDFWSLICYIAKLVERHWMVNKILG